MPSEEPNPDARPGRIDWLISRVIDSAREFVVASARIAAETDARRERSCVFVIDGSDRVAVEFHAHCVRAGMGGPRQLKTTVVTTFLAPFEPILLNAAAFYALDEHAEAPLAPDEVRAVVLTLGTLTVVRLGSDGTARRASFSYAPRRRDVLLVAVAVWRNDRPEGFLLKAVFRTRAGGDRFLALYRRYVKGLEKPSTKREVLERNLARVKALARTQMSTEVQARVYAEVHWLEANGMLPDDDFNGTVFSFGYEMDLQDVEERMRLVGGPARPLN